MPTIRTNISTHRPTVLVSIQSYSDDSLPSHHFHQALLDTGEEVSSISKELLDTLNISEDVATFSIYFPLRGNDTDPIDTLEFHELKPVPLHTKKRSEMQAPIVLGMDVIKKHTLVISGEMMIFSF